MRPRSLPIWTKRKLWQNIDLNFHLWIVLDGPSATPQEVWEKLRQTLGENFTLIALPTNQGKGAALKAALAKAHGKYSFYADADLPYPPSELIKMLLALAQGADVVVGARQKSYYQQLPPLRIWISKRIAWLNHLFLGPDNDTQGGLKGLNRRGRWIFQQALARRYLFDLDALYRAHAAHLTIKSIPIEIRTALQFKNYTLRNYAQEFFSLLRAYGHILIWPLLAFLFGYLTYRTFHITADQQYKIGVLVFHDYAANLPLVRSFSWGWNFPVEYPVFAFAPIRYHYLYFMLIGFLERAGIPLDWAFNLPSVLGLLLLLGLIFQQTYRWFKSKLTAYLAMFLFIFPGHGLISDFKQKIAHLQWPDFWSSLWANDHFVGNYPWEQDNFVASSLWNLNVYLNQRHFIWAMAFVLAVFSFFTAPKFLASLKRRPSPISLSLPRTSSPRRIWICSAIFAILMGLMPLWHLPSLIGLAIVMLSLLILVPAAYRPLLGTGLLAGLIMLLVNFTCFNFLQPALKNQPGLWHPFWMLHNCADFLKFWHHNLAWHLIFFPLGLWAAGKKRRFALPGILLFLAGSFVRFTEVEVNQHKLFCFAFLWMVPFSAWGLVWSAQQIGKLLSFVRYPAIRRSIQGIYFSGFVFCLMRGGLFDLLPIIHQDQYTFLPKLSDQQVLAWIKDHTSPRATFISNHPSLNFPLIAGRRMFSSWPSYAAGLGYPGVGERNYRNFEAYTWPSPEDGTPFDFRKLCVLLLKYHIDYAIFENWAYYVHGDQPPYDLERLAQQKKPDYYNDESQVSIYTPQNICAGINLTPGQNSPVPLIMAPRPSKASSLQKNIKKKLSQGPP